MRGGSVTSTGARLSRAARREQLIALGHDLVAQRSFETVSVDDVAAAAGISRGLLFHYFPTKRDFQAAIAERAGDELLLATDPDPDRPPLEQLRTSIERLIDHVAPRRAAYVSLVRGAASGEPALREVADRTRARLVERVLDGLDLPATPPEVTLVVRGWVVGTEELVVAWLTEPTVSRERLVELIVSGLLAQLAALVGPDDLDRLTATS